MGLTGIVLFVCCAAVLSAQDAMGPAVKTQLADGHSAPTCTVHGIVRNATTGSPLPRALVRVYGSGTGALTDGDGRFEIPGVDIGGVLFSVVKPGFFDSNAGPSAGFGPGAREFAHTILAGPSMPDVVFALSPLNAIRGQVLLPSGEPAAGIAVTLLKQGVDGGRMQWQVQNHTTVNADGMYRFGGLMDGIYAIHTELAMENELFTPLLDANSAREIRRSGYRAQFYPDAHDLSGASKIRLQNGATVQADMALTLEPFHAVTAKVLFQGGAPPRQFMPGADATGVSYSAQVFDSEGYEHLAQYEADSNTVQALLPDGDYTVMVAANTMRVIPEQGRFAYRQDPDPLSGSVDFPVAGHAIAGLRIPLATHANGTVEVDLASSATVATQPASSARGGEMAVQLTLTEAAGSNENFRRAYAQGPVSGPLHIIFTGPGTYWVHTSIGDPRVCEASLMAGGTNLAREPLVLGPDRPAEPLRLNLRDDCATLTLTLPDSASAEASAEEQRYEIYVVPEFDSTTDVNPQTLAVERGAAVTLRGLTPGRYRVYAFSKPTGLAYHDQDALAALPNPPQEIDLEPGAKASLMLEVPRQ
jgi:hypothetical protein